MYQHAYVFAIIKIALTFFGIHCALHYSSTENYTSEVFVSLDTCIVFDYITEPDFRCKVLVVSLFAFSVFFFFLLYCGSLLLPLPVDSLEPVCISI